MKEQTQSPCEKLGYKEGDEFFYTGEDDDYVHFGERIILKEDDGTYLPFFKRADGGDCSFCHYLADVTPASDPFVAYNGVEYTRGWYKFYDNDPSKFVIAELTGVNDNSLFPFCANTVFFMHCEMVDWSEYTRGFISTGDGVNKLYKLYTLALEGTGQKPMDRSEFATSGLLDKYKELCE